MRPQFFPATETMKKVIKNERLKHEEEDTVKWFSGEMIRILAKNRKKGGWKKCSFEYLYSRLWDEVLELGQREKSNRQTIIKESSDVANIAMMIADIARNRK